MSNPRESQPAELSAYERERLENIARNQAVLASLGLASGGTARLPASGGTARLPPSRPLLPPKRRKVEPRPPERRSARLVDGAKAPDYYIADESASGKVTVGGTAADLLASQAMEEVEEDPLFRFGLGGMPKSESELLPCEQVAFEALRDAKRAKASELQIEGYKVAQHQSLCEMVRRCPESIEELRGCWGFGGSGVRVDKYGELFLEALRPHVSALRAAHAAARVEYEAVAAAAAGAAGGEASDAAKAAAAAQARAQAQAQAVRDVRAARELDDEARGPESHPMPEKITDLLPGAEVAAYEALLAATHVRADEIGERYVWNICHVRSLCEMVRRCPSTPEELRLCWGFGGKGVRADRHGDFLLAALAPHIDALRQAQAAEAREEDEEEAGAPVVADEADAEGAAKQDDEGEQESMDLSTHAQAAKKSMAGKATRSGRATAGMKKEVKEESQPPTMPEAMPMVDKEEPDVPEWSVPPRRPVARRTAAAAPGLSPAPETRQTRGTAAAKRKARV
jgi:hypothetical protein